VANGRLVKDILTENRKLIPVEKLHDILEHDGRLDFYRSKYNIFPLEWFDDFDFDPMSPARWLSIAHLQGEAFLPRRSYSHLDRNTSMCSSLAISALTEGSYAQDVKDKARMKVSKRQFEGYLNTLYRWTLVDVVGYDDARYLWHVYEPKFRRRYEVPRIYLRFLIEDPDRFVDRVQYAEHKRNVFERNLKFGFLLENMSMSKYLRPGDVFKKCQVDDESFIKAFQFECAVLDVADKLDRKPKTYFGVKLPKIEKYGE
jgi:hypothetical protein